jgi:coiled-coil and C2 domain-containing protein 2A
MRAGDWEEHAILLCNYLLYMKQEAYVLIGSGFEGETAYVLLKENAEYSLFNGVTGEFYSIKDTLCPLKNVAMVFNSTNVSYNLIPLYSTLNYFRFGQIFKNLENHG